MQLVGEWCQHRDVVFHCMAAHANGDNTYGLPRIKVITSIGFLTAVLASCWSWKTKTVQKPRGSAAVVHSCSWGAPRLQQLSPMVCCAPRDKSLRWPHGSTLRWDHPQCHGTHQIGCLFCWAWGSKQCGIGSVQRAESQCSVPANKIQTECRKRMNQLIIPFPTAPVHSLVSELGFFAFLQSSWRWDVEHGVLLLLTVLKKNISSAHWHVFIICEGKMSARFEMREAFSSSSYRQGLLGSKVGKQDTGAGRGTGYHVPLRINLVFSQHKFLLWKTGVLGGSFSLFLWCSYLWL